MILLVFEGQKEEPKIMATIKSLFFKEEDQLLCSYGTDTYTLWKDVLSHSENGYDADVFTIVKERMHTRGDYSLDKYDSHQIDSIYLFFDFDPQTSLGLDTLIPAIKSIVNTFNNPMEQGEIYISYPMVEALYCENIINDKEFISSVVTIEDCHSFKTWARKYDFDLKRDNLLLMTNKDGIITEDPDEVRLSGLKKSWLSLISMNSIKANAICNDDFSNPSYVLNIRQDKIFDHQISDYVEKSNTVAILSSFPLFLFEYFHGNGEI